MDNTNRQRNEQEEIVQLLTNAQHQLTRYIRTLVPHRADADEVLQETNLFIWRRIDEYEMGTSFTAWACKIAYYHVLTLRKRNARNRLRFSDTLVEQLASNLARHPDRAEADVEAFELCMAKLNVQDRELIQLRYEPGATVDSVARQVGRSTKAVYAALGRIRTGLLECIQRSLSERRKS